MRIFFATLCAIATIALVVSTEVGNAQDKPKYTVKQVMHQAHKSKLLAEAMQGKAEKAKLEKLVELYVALGANESPAGEKDDWKKRTDEIISAAKEVLAGKEGAAKKLQKATNCRNCHDEHKG